MTGTQIGRELPKSHVITFWCLCRWFSFRSSWSRCLAFWLLDRLFIRIFSSSFDFFSCENGYGLLNRMREYWIIESVYFLYCYLHLWISFSLYVQLQLVLWLATNPQLFRFLFWFLLFLLLWLLLLMLVCGSVVTHLVPNAFFGPPVSGTGSVFALLRSCFRASDFLCWTEKCWRTQIRQCEYDQDHTYAAEPQRK